MQSHNSTGRSPHGERGLKCNHSKAKANRYGRSPHGERGLKYAILRRQPLRSMSLPSRGAWIEIKSVCIIGLLVASRSPHGERGLKLCRKGVTLLVVLSLPSRGAWIEIFIPSYATSKALSLPSRGAWIEIHIGDVCQLAI